MKGIRKNITLLSVLTCALSAVLCLYMFYALDTYGDRWFSSAYNKRLQKQRENVSEGRLLDRNGEILAQTVDDKRVYNPDDRLRRATGQIVGDSTGRIASGAESFMARYLLGFDNGAASRFVSYLLSRKTKGKDVTLTIDARLCADMLDALDGFDGAAIAMNYDTGEIVGMASSPAYDQNAPGDGTGSSYVNRATMGRYTPGSVFKLVTATAALRYIDGVAEREFDCVGPLLFDADTGKYLPDEYISAEQDAALKAADGSDESEAISGALDDRLLLRDLRSQYHGSINLGTALSKSCNNVFGRLTLEIGAERMKRTAAEFGIGQNQVFRDIVLYDSVYDPGSADYSLAWSGDGQFKDIVTPMQIALITSAIACGGVMNEPKLLKAVNGETVLETTRYSVPMTGGESELLTKYMRLCATEGTGRAAQTTDAPVCVKTGTAEVSDAKNAGDHAWCTGFIDDGGHPFVVTVILEHAGSGGEKAAPAVGRIFKALIERGY